jgi:alpha-tubulin suppressor-like RCC1 family protein
MAHETREEQATARELLPWSFPEAYATAVERTMMPVSVIQVAAGASHALLLDTTGAVWGIGRSAEGQLGLGLNSSGASVSSAVQVNALKGRNIRHVAAGGWHSLAIDKTGIVFTWGDNRYGQCGVGSDNASIPTPLEVPGPPILTGDCGARHTVLIREGDRAHVAAGDNRKGQCGVVWEDETVEELREFSECSVVCKAKPFIVSCGSEHTVLVGETGTLWSFGGGRHYQLGHGSKSDCPSPKRAAKVSTKWVTHAAAGAAHTLAVTEDGGVWVVGTDVEGMGYLGLGAGVTVAKEFTQIPGINPVQKVAAGPQHSLATEASTGQLLVWGEQSLFRLGLAANSHAVTPTLTGKVCLEEMRDATRIISEGASAAAVFNAERTLRGLESSIGPLPTPTHCPCLKLVCDERDKSMFPYNPVDIPSMPSPDLSETRELRRALKELSRLPAETLKTLSDAQVIEMKRSFDQVDVDQSGAIDSAELHSALLSVGQSTISHEEAEEVIRRFDQSGDGELQFIEFVQLVLAVQSGSDGSFKSMGGALASVVAGGNEVSAAGNAKIRARLDALLPANIRLEARRVCEELSSAKRPHLTHETLGKALERMAVRVPPKQAIQRLALDLSGQQVSSFRDAWVPEHVWLEYLHAVHPLTSPSTPAVLRAAAELRYSPPSRVTMVKSRRFVKLFRELLEEENISCPAALSRRLDIIESQSPPMGLLVADGVLDLSSCSMRDSHVAILCNAIRQVPIFSSLDLTRNSISDAGVAAVVELLDNQIAQSNSWEGAGGAGDVVERGVEFLTGFASPDGQDDAPDPSAELDRMEVDLDEASRLRRRAKAVESAQHKAELLARRQHFSPEETADLVKRAGEDTGSVFDERFPPIDGRVVNTEMDSLRVGRLEPAFAMHGLDDEISFRGRSIPQLDNEHQGSDKERAQRLAEEQSAAVWGCVPWIRVNWRLPEWTRLIGCCPEVSTKFRFDELNDGGPLYDGMGRRETEFHMQGRQRVVQPSLESLAAEPPDTGRSESENWSRPSTMAGARAARLRGAERLAKDVDELFQPTPPSSRPPSRPATAVKAGKSATPGIDLTVVGQVTCPQCGESDTSTRANPVGRNGRFTLLQDTVKCVSCGCEWMRPTHVITSVRIVDTVGPQRLLSLAKHNLQTGSRQRLLQFLRDRTECTKPRGTIPPGGHWGVSEDTYLEEYQIITEGHSEELAKALAGASMGELTTDPAPLLTAFREYGRSLDTMHQSDYLTWTRAVIREGCAQERNRLLAEIRELYSHLLLPQDNELFYSSISRLWNTSWDDLMERFKRWTFDPDDVNASKDAHFAFRDQIVRYYNNLITHSAISCAAVGEALSVVLTGAHEAWMFGKDTDMVSAAAPRVLFLARPCRGGEHKEGLREVFLGVDNHVACYGADPTPEGFRIREPTAQIVWDAIHVDQSLGYASFTIQYQSAPSPGMVVQHPVMDLRLGDREGPSLGVLRVPRPTVGDLETMTVSCSRVEFSSGVYHLVLMIDAGTDMGGSLLLSGVILTM